MFRKALLPVMLVVLGAFSASVCVTGCSDSGGGGGTGGKGTGGKGTGGASSGGAPGTGGASSGGAPGTGGASSGGAPATGGAAGAATGGAAGSAGGSAGSSMGGRAGGASGAAGGAAGSSMGGRAGGNSGSTGGAAGGAGGGSAPTPAQVEAKCAMDAYGTANGTGTFTPAEFCALYLDTCDPPAGDYDTLAKCTMKWSMVTTNAHCRTYHLCNAATAGPAATHCPHAVGMMLCTGN